MWLIDLSSLLVQAVNIAIIIYVLRRFIFIPYLKYIDEEIAKRADLEAKTENASLIVDEASGTAKQLIDAAKSEANEIRKNARDLAKWESALVLSKANTEVAGIKRQAEEEITAERKMLENEMRTKILSVAIALNTKLFGDSKKNAELLEQFSKQM